MVISNWVLSAIPMLLSIWIPNTVGIISVPVESVCYLTTAFFYFKIYLAVRHHSNQIHVLQAQLAKNNEGDMTNAARERKTAVGTFYVYLVFSDLLSAIHVCLDYPHKHWTKYEAISVWTLY